MKKKVFAVALGVLLLLKTVDWLLMEKLFFKIPNTLEWDTSPWYNFLAHTKRIEFASEEKGVLVVGSSIALYSVLPDILNRPQTPELTLPYRAEMYSHVAMAPTDVYFYLPDIIAKKPDAVVYVFNPADFQLEYIEPIDGSNGYVFREDSWLRHFAWRHPARLFYPNAFAWEYLSQLTKAEIYKLLGKGFLFTNRYREFFWDPIDSYVERYFRSGRSYHIYTGAVPIEGIWPHGWTNSKFSVDCDITPISDWNSSRKLRNLSIAGKKVVHRTESVYIPQPDTDLEILYADGRKQTLAFAKPGWAKLELEFVLDDSDLTTAVSGTPGTSRPLTMPGTQSQQRIRIEVSKTHSSRLADQKPYGKEYAYGVRLSQNFCSSSLPENFAYNRPNLLDEARFREMSLPEYESDYFERIYKDSEQRPELYRMKILAEKKSLLAEQEFHPWLEIERFRKIQGVLEAQGIRFFMVLSPENPIELKKYRGHRWYYGMLDYFGLMSRGHFFDFGSYLSDPRLFSDPHHLTYEGAEKFSKELREVLWKEFTFGDEND